MKYIMIVTRDRPIYWARFDLLNIGRYANSSVMPRLYVQVW